MHDTAGNLALKRRKTVTRKHKAQVLTLKPAHQPIKARRVSVQETPDANQINMIRSRQIRKKLAFHRMKMLASLICMVLVIAGLFSFVVYRQAMIVEMNFDNLARERLITQIGQENSQLSESLAQQTNLDYIRQQAIEKLGLQDPARSQIVPVYVPDSDRVIFNTADQRNMDDDAYLASVFNTLEGFFLNLSQQRKVD